MISDELRKKLEALNRGPLKIDPERAKSAAPGPPSPRTLEECVEGIVIGEPARPCFCVERPLDKALDSADRLLEAWRDVFVRKRVMLNEEDALRWDYLLGCDPTRILFLDIETLGLTSTPVFLVGTIHLADDGRMHLRQIFARDYAEERHILEHFAGRVGDFDVIVTYNGKTFDWPYLRDRANYHAVRLTHSPEHMDLLHEARRRWRHILPNCKLQTLEYHVCRRRRTGDIPGDMIAEAYHHYVKTGDARRMETVIHHNALDLVTMVELMLFMLQGGDLVWE